MKMVSSTLALLFTFALASIAASHSESTQQPREGFSGGHILGEVNRRHFDPRVNEALILSCGLC